MQQATRIVIIGAGYAGLIATTRLAGKTRRASVSITLVNAADSFVERLRLHQVAANQTIPQRRIEDTLRGTGVNFVQGIVTGIDPQKRSVNIQTGNDSHELGYDKLVYALGSTIDRDSVPGVRDHAYVLTPSGSKSVQELREVLLARKEQGGRLLICGGGATGIEAAAEFAESYRKLGVQLVTEGEFGMFLGKRAADYMRRSLTRLGVVIQENTTICEVQPSQVSTANGAAIPYDICLWTGGFSVPVLARATGLSVNERGQILIDPFMRSVSHPDIYAAGDAAHPLEEPGVPVRMSAFAAAVMGAHTADCLSRVVQNKIARPLSFAYYGAGIALGRHDAIGFNTFPDDKPNRPYFTGKLGYEFREFFVRFLANLPNLERRFPGALYWMGKGRYVAAKRRAQRAATIGNSVSSASS